MPRARLAVTLPPSSSLGNVTRAHPDAHISVRTAVPNADTGGITGHAVLRAPELPSVVAALAADDDVTIDVLSRTDGQIRCHLETAGPCPLAAAATAGVPPAFPFPVADGTLRWDVTAPQAALSALATALESAGFAFDVTSVSSSVESQLLTPNQRRVLDAAVDGGYFETPRGCSLGALASELDVAKSTCSETLRRAEQTILSRYLEADTVAGETR